MIVTSDESLFAAVRDDDDELRSNASPSAAQPDTPTQIAAHPAHPRAMDFLKSAVASAIAKGPPFPYTFGDKVDMDPSIWTLYNGTRRVGSRPRPCAPPSCAPHPLGLRPADLSRRRRTARIAASFPSTSPPIALRFPLPRTRSRSCAPCDTRASLRFWTRPRYGSYVVFGEPRVADLFEKNKKKSRIRTSTSQRSGSSRCAGTSNGRA